MPDEPWSKKPKTTTDGEPPTDGNWDGPAPKPIGPDGQHEAYYVLPDSERAKGFVRPVRRSYVHIKCGAVTRMGVKLAETYARDPSYYSQTFCCRCGTHLPVGSKESGGEFVWDGAAGAITKPSDYERGEYVGT